jgi:hypothetical protein
VATPKTEPKSFAAGAEGGLGGRARLLQGARVETGQKLDLLERDTELGAFENLVGSGDADGVLMVIGAGRSRNRRA